MRLSSFFFLGFFVLMDRDLWRVPRYKGMVRTGCFYSLEILLVMDETEVDRFSGDERNAQCQR
jgi:hypothetical protein